MELNKKYPIANSMVVFREEFDDWAVLFDPDANVTLGLNPVSAYVWKKLDGRHTIESILKSLKAECDEVPEDAARHIDDFLADLEKRGLVGYEIA